MLFSTLAAAGQAASPLLAGAALAVFAAVLTWAAAVDASRRIIPNAAVAAGCAGWFAVLLASELSGIDVRAAAAEGLAAGLLLLAGLLVFAVAFERATGRASMGGGDIKLLAMCGLYLGLSASLLTLAAACVSALAVETVRSRRRAAACVEADGPDPDPAGAAADGTFAFGPYIAAASCAVAVCAAMLGAL